MSRVSEIRKRRNMIKDKPEITAFDCKIDGLIKETKILKQARKDFNVYIDKNNIREYSYDEIHFLLSVIDSKLEISKFLGYTPTVVALVIAVVSLVSGIIDIAFEFEDLLIYAYVLFAGALIVLLYYIFLTIIFGYLREKRIRKYTFLKYLLDRYLELRNQ